MECPWDGHSLLTGLRPRNAKECPMPTPKIRPRLSPQPAPIAATLDLSQPGERTAHDLLRRFCTGRWPIWRLLALRRADGVLCAAVEWVHGKARSRFAVAELSLREDAVCWRYFPTAAAARKSLSQTGRAAAPMRSPARIKSAA